MMRGRNVVTVKVRVIPDTYIFWQNWKSMYHYMKRAEHYRGPSERVAELYGINSSASDYGISGLIQVLQ